MKMRGAAHPWSSFVSRQRFRVESIRSVNSVGGRAPIDAAKNPTRNLLFNPCDDVRRDSSVFWELTTSLEAPDC